MSKKVAIAFLLITVLVALLPTTTVLAYLYRSPIAVTENASSSYSMLPILWDSNNQWMVDNGFIPSVLGTRVQTLGGLNKPWMVADNKTLTAIPVPANSQTNLYFVTGESEASAMDIILGNGGYVTTSDSPSLELGDNFTLVWDSYIDTTNGTDKHLIQKAAALAVYINPTISGNLSAVIFGTTVDASANMLVDGTGDYTNLSLSGAATNWQAVLTNDGNTSYVYVSGTNVPLAKDAYTLQQSSPPSPSVPVSVSVTWYGISSTTNLGQAQPFLRLGGVESAGTQIIENNTAGYGSHTEIISRPGGGSWSWSDINNLQVVIGLNTYNGSAGWTRVTYGYVTVNYNDGDIIVTATGVSNGEHVVELSADSANLTLTLDGVVVDNVALGGAFVPANNSNWVFMQNNVTPYVDSITVSVNGTLALWYEPNAIILTTNLPDRSGSNNDGTITWGSNPAGVGATLGSMSSSGRPGIGATSDTSTSDTLPIVGGTDWRPDAEVSATLQANPMRPIVTAVSDNTTLSEYQVWVWLGIIFVVFVTVSVGANVRGHHLITGIAMAAAITLMVVWTVFPWLVLIIAAIVVWGGLVSERSPSL